MRRMEAGRRERGRACKFPKIVASSFSQFHKLCLPCVVILENYYNTTCYRRLWRQPCLPREGLCLGALPYADKNSRSMQLVSAACEKRGAGGLMDAVTKVFLLELQLLFIIWIWVSANTKKWGLSTCHSDLYILNGMMPCQNCQSSLKIEDQTAWELAWDDWFRGRSLLRRWLRAIREWINKHFFIVIIKYVNTNK